MHADRGKQIRILARKDDRHRTAGGHAGYIDPFTIKSPGEQELANQTRDDRRLSLIPTLVAWLEPVPALRNVGGLRLRGIDDHARALLRQGVHARADREVIGRLRTAVQHHDQRQWLASVRAGNEELVAENPGRTLVRVLAELRTLVRGRVSALRRTALGAARGA